MLKFTSDHEWLLVENGTATVGITQFAQEQLGDLIFIELPKVGASLAVGGLAVVVESVKTASEVYSPIDGEVTGINEGVSADPTLVNADPLGKGWLFKMKISDLSQIEKMMDEAAYRSMVEAKA